MNSTVKQVITWVVLAVAAIVLWQVVKNGTSGPKERDITLTEFISNVEQNSILDATIRGSEVSGKFRNNEPARNLLLNIMREVVAVGRKKGVNLDAWCKHQYGDTFKAVVRGSTAVDWGCEDRRQVSAKDACILEYGNSVTGAKALNPNDPTSWVCTF